MCLSDNGKIENEMKARKEVLNKLKNRKKNRNI